MTVMHYTKSQIALHWTIVILVATQFLTADAMSEFFDKADESGVLAGFPMEPTASLHAIIGGAIVVLTAFRMGLRLRNGAPTAPASLSPLLQFVARGIHAGFYALLVAVPITGAVALYVTAEAGDVHVLLKDALFLLIVLHVAGALAHALYFKDGIVRRMLP